MDQTANPAQDLESLKNEVAGIEANKPKPEFKAAVGMSRLWDARTAGREVAEDTLKKLEGKKPDFVLLFSTIHYEKHGGFKELLKGVWEVLPKGTPLIGGTVQGFLSNYGCFIRGVTALAVFSPALGVSTGIGHNTKRTPNIAANQLSGFLKSKRDKHENDCIIELVSGVTIPNLPFLGPRVIIPESILGVVASKLFFLSSILNTGPDKADEIIVYLSKIFPASTITGACLSDDGKMMRNFQFYRDQVYTNSIVGLKLNTDRDIVFETIQPLKPTGQKINVSELSADKRTIIKLNGKKAAKEYLKIIGTDLKFLGQRHTVARTTFYFPMAYKKGDFYHPCLAGPIINGSIVVGNIIEKNDLELCVLSPELLIEKITEVTKEMNKIKDTFIFGIACQTIVETLGNNIYEVQKIMNENLQETPFLTVLAAGESFYIPMSAHHVYESFNLLTLK